MAALHIALRLPRDRFTLSIDTTLAASSVGIFGPSGAGKSSLLEALVGLDRGVRGRIAFDGEIWLDSAAGRDLPAEARDIGYVPQEGLLFPHLDVRANLLAGAARARRHGLDLPATLAAVSHMLEIEPLLDRRPATLSGGERQRVALARAICSGPRLLALDEPLAALDLPLRRRILPLLRQVRDTLALPLLLVSHDATEIQALCDEILVLHEGRVVAQGPTREVLADPQVFPLARSQGFENLLPARLVSSGEMVSTVRLVGATHDEGREDSPLLLVPQVAKPLGAPLLVALPAREILLASEQPRGLSARNVLPATVESVHGTVGLRLISARLDGPTGAGSALPSVLVEITADAERELAVVPGRRVYLIVKTMGCTVC